MSSVCMPRLSLSAVASDNGSAGMFLSLAIAVSDSVCSPVLSIPNCSCWVVMGFKTAVAGVRIVAGRGGLDCVVT